MWEYTLRGGRTDPFARDDAQPVARLWRVGGRKGYREPVGFCTKENVIYFSFEPRGSVKTFCIQAINSYFSL